MAQFLFILLADCLDYHSIIHWVPQNSGNLSSVVRGGWEVQGQGSFSFGKTYLLAYRWFLLAISSMVERMRNLSSSFEVGALIPLTETHTHDLTTS